jgi:hypothetical protein
MTDASAPRATYRPLAAPLALLAGLTIVSAALAVISGGLARGAVHPLTNPVLWLNGMNVGAALDMVSNSAEVVAAVLAIAITVVAIVVELAANRYSHEITRLFLREPVNLVVLSLYVLTTLQCIWTAAGIDAGDAGSIPHAALALTLGMVVLSLLLLVPYIYFVFAFLSPISVIQRISRDAYRRVERLTAANASRSQGRVEEAVDQLQDVARSALGQGDRSIAMAAVNAMAQLLRDYVGIQDRLPANWFKVTDEVASDPDFVALAPETIAEVEAEGVWLERKVFRRYLSLMRQCVGEHGDIANVIGINTQQIASSMGASRPSLLELCRRALNSYLRTAINARDARTAYFLMNQYRLVGERLMRQGRNADVVAVADYLKEYGQLANAMGLPFLLETAAYDIMQLVEDALASRSPSLDALLDCFLTVDQQMPDEQAAETQLGVRRAQMQLATLLLLREDTARADRVIDDLRTEAAERLNRLRAEMLADDRPQFWELMDRGVNFRYLPPERRPFLDTIMARLPATAP